MGLYSRAVLGWLVVMLLTGCVASQPQPPTPVQPAMDRLLIPGDIQVAQENLAAFGFDPGPVNGVFTAETQAKEIRVWLRIGCPAYLSRMAASS
jgi:hypothetical protein